MNIRVLGCSGAIAAGSKTTSFLLDDHVLIDAGTGVGDLSLDALTQIDHILVSHSHLDHIVSIALLADSVMRKRAAQGRPPIQVHGLAPTLQALRTHIFNGIIWPDFTVIPSAQHPALQLCPFEVGDQLDLGDRRVEVLSAAHTVPAVGFAVLGATEHAPCWVFTGDTGPNIKLWERLKQMNVGHLVIETAFSNDDCALAALSKHLCPDELARELQHLAGSCEVHITHIKPGEVGAVMDAIHAQVTRHKVRALQAGDVMVL